MADLQDRSGNPFASPDETEATPSERTKPRPWAWWSIGAIYATLGALFIVVSMMQIWSERAQRTGDFEVGGISLLTISAVVPFIVYSLLALNVGATLLIVFHALPQRRWGLLLLAIPGVTVILNFALAIILTAVDALGIE